jgi:tetratricopeptide (TPR) repeat protein
VTRAQAIQAAVEAAIALHRAGRVAEAEKVYRDVLRQDPNHPDALHLLGLIAHHAGQAAAAEQLMRRAIAVDPGVALYHLNLAKVYRGAGHPAEGLACATRATELNPRFAEAHVERSACLLGCRRAEEGAAAARAALALNPRDPQARGALGNALSDLGKLDEAIVEYRAVLSAHPRHAETLNNLGEALRKLGFYDEAERHLVEAVRFEPRVGDPHFNLSLIRLVRGDFERGWADYEWRWRQTGVHPPRYDRPLWDGAPLEGKTILLHAEQGLGDAMQFVRYALRVARERGAGRVIVRCQPTLIKLFETVEGVAEVIAADASSGSDAAGATGASGATGATLPAFDVHCPLMSLPQRFGTTLETIPAQCPYFGVDQSRVARWRQSLKLRSDDGVLKVGLVWAGSKVQKNDRNRSACLNDFAPLGAAAGSSSSPRTVRWFSLQLGEPARQLTASPPAGMTIEDPTAQIRDMSDTAALMSALDLIITVDSAPAHLAGALARPAWVLLPHVPDFRWLLDRADSPWYPTLRLFRQSRAGDWAGVMNTMSAALAGEIEDK